MRDSLNEARRELASLEEEHAEELARFDDEYIQISQQMLDRWQIWCAKTTPNKKLSAETRLRDKFVKCFPLAAHAINDVV